MTNGLKTSVDSSGLNLQDLVKNATWREILIDLVETDKLDPWDIDIIKIVDGYIAAVRKMQVMDLHIPANIILAASILLRMKSETINVMQMHEEEFQPDEQMREHRAMPEVPGIIPRLRLQPKRKITLGELMDALGDAIKINERREIISKQKVEPLNFTVEKEDIDERLSATHKLVVEQADKEGLTTFAHLSKYFDSLESALLKLFVPLLFLAHRGDVTLMQDQFFNEIFVKLNSKAG